MYPQIASKGQLPPTLAAMPLACVASAATASGATPPGLWTTIDDRSGKVRSELPIDEPDGALDGGIERIILPGRHNRCVAYFMGHFSK